MSEINNNVIELDAFRKSNPTKSHAATAVEEAPVVDMTERRQEMIQDERREVKRTILTEFIGAFAVIPDQGLSKVSIYDISENGIAFDTDLKMGALRGGEEIAVRVYLNQTTFFPFVVKVKNVRIIEDEQVHRHGGEFVNGTVNDEALHHFVRFIETVSASLKTDHGDIMVSNLQR